jgi:fatty acid desaturase
VLEEINAFGAELDALRKETMATLGKKEADYIYGVRNFVRYTEIAGRSSLMLGWLPPFWLAGTALLGVSKIVENMELGHNVMHGQYDWMNDASRCVVALTNGIPCVRLITGDILTILCTILIPTCVVWIMILVMAYYVCFLSKNGNHVF